MRDLYVELQSHYLVKPDKRGWCHVKCPFCGHDPERGRPRFSFNTKGFFCFLCNAKGSLKPLAQKVGLWTDSYYTPPAYSIPEPKEVEEEVLPEWRSHPQDYLDRYTSNPMRVEMWADYKPLKPETIEKHKMGIGQLPDQKMIRLIVPLFWGGEIVGFKGRKLPDAPEKYPKWIAATTSKVDVLWGIDHIEPNPRQLWICENYIDAALITQNHGYPAVAAGGARELKDYELEALRQLNPKIVVMAYDNDLVGQAGPALRKQLEEEWRAKNQGDYVPQSKAQMVLEALRRLGIRTLLFPYPAIAPHKADILWALENNV